MNDTPIPQSAPTGGGGGQNQPPYSEVAHNSFWRRNSTTLIRLIIVVVIIGGAIIYSKSQVPANPKDTTPTPATLTPPANSTLPVASESDKNQPAAPEERMTPKITPAPTPPPVRVSGGTITVAAQRGNGYTHLARRALASYLEGASVKSQIKPEHKIYIEDYLQKRLTKKSGLTAGTEVAFAQTEIELAIDRALKLNDRQLQNLHRYTLRVKNL